MIQEYQLRVTPQTAYNEQNIKAFLVRDKGLDARTIHAVRTLKKSIDARHRDIYINLKVRVYINEEPTDDVFVRTEYADVSSAPVVIVVGAGPGGLFAALRLIELGLRPIVLERGKSVRERNKDLSLISKTQKVNPESNYCFGEGGAGANSDGKLYTRSKKRGSVEKILNVFCQHGASPAILSDAHPHIGTDKLPKVIENMRNTIRSCGGEVYFQTKMTSFVIDSNKVIGVRAKTVFESDIQIEKVFHGPVILATGHSARDVYRYLAESKVEMEPKGIAVGVRLEHPSQLIDQIQYHNKTGRGKYLPAAEYSFVTQARQRGVYSFCMCPGGFVIPSASGPRQIVTNGMSTANRGSKWSNSGMVVQVNPDDLPGNDLLRMLTFQERMEQDAWQQGNMRQTAPAQRMTDFVNKRLSYDLPSSSYTPGLISSPLHFWMPPFVTIRLQEAFQTFGKQAHGFLTKEALMIAVETRTSSPVRILREPDTLMHLRLRGLFPCGEGAGYAGGIVSAGMDGERCAEMAKLYIEASLTDIKKQTMK